MYKGPEAGQAWSVSETEEQGGHTASAWRGAGEEVRGWVGARSGLVGG